MNRDEPTPAPQEAQPPAPGKTPGSGEGADTAYPGESLGARRAAFLVELQDVATQLDTIARITQASRSARGLR